MVTNGDKNYIRDSERIRHYRGLFSRVARQLGVDRSYVSRVASGERRSELVEKALAREIERVEKLLAARKPSTQLKAQSKQRRG